MANLQIGKISLLPFTLESKVVLEKYLSRLEIDLSDYTFAANYIWLANSSGFYAIINKCFCLFAMSGGELTMLLPPIGKKKDDMGFENLRKVKMSYRPFKLVPKYTIYQK